MTYLLMIKILIPKRFSVNTLQTLYVEIFSENYDYVSNRSVLREESAICCFRVYQTMNQ
jgi:hypothetical protein